MTTLSGDNVDLPSEAVVSIADIDAEFLPAIHDIIKTIEKDPQDAATKNKDGTNNEIEITATNSEASLGDSHSDASSIKCNKLTLEYDCSF